MAIIKITLSLMSFLRANVCSKLRPIDTRNTGLSLLAMNFIAIDKKMTSKWESLIGSCTLWLALSSRRCHLNKARARGAFYILSRLSCPQTRVDYYTLRVICYKKNGQKIWIKQRVITTCLIFMTSRVTWEKDSLA